MRWPRSLRVYRGAGVIPFCVDSDRRVRVLLGRRRFNPHKGRWSVPGGAWSRRDGRSPNGDFNFLAAALRECREEIGLELRERDVVLVHSINWGLFRWQMFAARVPLGYQPEHYRSEMTEMRWFEADALPADAVWFLRRQVVLLGRLVLSFH